MNSTTENARVREVALLPDSPKESNSVEILHTMAFQRCPREVVPEEHLSVRAMKRRRKKPF